jgi:hypothetical protein
MFACVCCSGGYNTFAIDKMNESPEEGVIIAARMG